MNVSHQAVISKFVEIFKGTIDAYIRNDLDKKLFFENLMSLVEFPALCLKCNECHDYLFYQEQFVNIYSGVSTADQVIKAMHVWHEVTLADKAMNAVSDRPLKFNRESFISPEKPIIYFDQNILSRLIDGSNSDLARDLDLIIKLDNYIFVYSPSHIEEIFKMSDRGNQVTFLNKIREITKNLSIQPFKSTMEIVEEDPQYPFDRIEITDGSTQAVEELKYLHTQRRKLYFPQYDLETHKKSIATRKQVFDDLALDEFQEIIAHSGTARRKKEEFKNLGFRLDILNAVYSLHNALDLLGYKLEKSDRTIKSSCHDIEHLIYATKAQFFITLDKTLAERADQIYKFMGVKTKILCGHEKIATLLSA